MICMDLVGHRLGPAGLPDEVGHTVFALGAERSIGTAALVRSIKHADAGVVVRTADADIIPPLSDYDAFWRAQIPFLFLSAGRSSVYHTPDDTPDKLDGAKILATTRWLERFVRATRTRPGPIRFDDSGSGDAATLDELGELLSALAPRSPEACIALTNARSLRAACDRTGRLPESLRSHLGSLAVGLETRLGA